MHDVGERAPSLRVLVVCTANVCRSPVAAALLERHLRRRGMPAAVRSAGTRGGVRPVHPDTVAAADALAVDLRHHRSRPLEHRMLADEGADLVVGMTRGHLREVVALDADAWHRTFTLKELARRTTDMTIPAGGVAEMIALAAAGRTAADLLGSAADDDLADPYGSPAHEHVAMVAEVDRLTAMVAAALARAGGAP